MRLRHALGLLVLVSLALACGAQPARPRTPPVPALDDAPPAATTLRLSPSITLDGQELSLRVDPREETFSGSTVIHVTLAEPSSQLVLHGRDLELGRATAGDAKGVVTARVRTRRALGGREADEELVLDVPRPLAGAVTLELAWTAPFAKLRGLYRVKVDDDWYAFTQLEAVDARRMFPSFDEPRFKAPWTIAVEVPAGMSAYGNAPLVRTEAAPGGFVRHVFEKTAPLPSYLVALAIGNLDAIPFEGEPGGPPLRLLAPRHHAQEGVAVLEEARAMLGWLARTTGLSHPYPKLDLVAVPDFGPGAMENPGLVTFREELLLSDHAPLAVRRRRSGILAHELSHLWFGDLVTMKWWDDLWLNESFATWMGARVTDAVHPGFGARLELVGWKLDAMGSDELPSARPVRLPVETSDAIHEAGGWSAYSKGASILAMLEAWMTSATFDDALHRYLEAHRHGNAVAADLFAALDAVTAPGAAKPSAFVPAYFDRTGVPTVTATATCNAKTNVTQLALRADPSDWSVPVCASAGASRECALVQAGAGALRLPACGAYWGNAAETGYYRFVGDAAARPATDVERMAALSGAWALVERGKSDVSAFLDAAQRARLEGEPSRVVLDRAIATLGVVMDRAVSDEATVAFQRSVRRWLGPRLKALGFATRAGESDDDRLLRASLFGALWDLGRDPAVAAAAEPLAKTWLDDPARADPELAPIAVRISAAAGGCATFGVLRARLAPAAHLGATQRTVVLGALASLPPSCVGETFELVAGGGIQPSEFRYVWGALGRTREGRALGAKFVRAHFEELRKVLGAVSGLAGTIGWACDPTEQAAAVAFFQPKLATFEGMQRSFDEGLETSRRCVALRARESSAAAAWLAAH